MSQSLSQQLMHIIFSTKRRFPFLKNPVVLEKTFLYIQAACSNQHCPLIAIGGTKDHIHLLLNLNKSLSLSNFIEEIKKSSSRFLKTLTEYDNDLSKFYWQRGYGAFSVSQSNSDSVKRYIENQPIHHQQFNFKEELRKFLNKHGVTHDETFLWD